MATRSALKGPDSCNLLRAVRLTFFQLKTNLFGKQTQIILTNSF